MVLIDVTFTDDGLSDVNQKERIFTSDKGYLILTDVMFTDDGGLSGVSRKERMFALKSIRRDRKREKDQRKKLQSSKNILLVSCTA